MHLTYLMWKRGIGFRVGISGVYTQRGGEMVGIRQRCAHEHADAVWVIGAHDTDAEARAEEVLLSLRYGLPTIPFVRVRPHPGETFVGDQDLIDRLFTTLDTETAGHRLLEDEGLASRSRTSRRDLGSRRRGVRGHPMRRPPWPDADAPHRPRRTRAQGASP